MNYYNYKMEEVLDMDVKSYNKLNKCMLINESRDALMRLEIISYPNLKKEAQEKIYRKYNKAAYPANFEKKNIVRLSDLSKVLR